MGQDKYMYVTSCPWLHDQDWGSAFNVIYKEKDG